ARLMLVASLVLLGFFTVTGLTLERAFRQSIETGLRDQLQTQIYLLLGAAELDADGRLTMPAVLAEPRLAVPGSELTGAIWSEGKRLWLSRSALGRSRLLTDPEVITEPRPKAIGSVSDGRWLSLAFPVIWELESGRERSLVFQMAVSRATADREISAFRRNIAVGLGGAGLALLIAQALALHWGLRPLRRVVAELQAIERGDLPSLSARSPPELEPLIRNLNALIASNATRLKRYRQALDDLSHSLKTPLAVLRTLDTPDLDGERRALLREQTVRIDQATAYFTARGASAGSTTLGTSVKVQAAIQPLLKALTKVHADKAVNVTTRIDPACFFRGDVADLSELLGNLLDNAFKWCRSEVRVAAEMDDSGVLHLTIEDDGPGIPPERRQLVTQRGARLDAAQPGQGIGLALVRDMVENAYEGELAIGDSTLGGTRIAIAI
ncbi:MAG: ATP-binding protein, partial [Pseudomonadota bacterium]